jgi:N5-(carboxyethyl)ornithine synthase
MKSIGFVISGKENERRRALLPADVEKIAHRDALVFEQSYAAHFGVPDDAYRQLGCRVGSRQETYACDVICNPKAPEPAERALYKDGQTFFGWAHAVQGRETTDFLLSRRMTAIAWEDMFESGRHVFWRNNEIAGEAAVLHAVSFLGRLPFGLRAAVMGLGNCGRGAYRTLAQLGVDVTVFDRRTSHLVRKDVEQFDIIVNAVLWDVFRTDHLIHTSDLRRMRHGSMIIDISCDDHMGIESSHSTPICDPVYEVDGVIHYVVDHTPALFWRSATEAISRGVAPYIDQIVTGEPGECLQRATAINAGRIVDERILRFQNRGAAGEQA